MGGKLENLHLELEDCSIIKSTIGTFTVEESRLDVLFNNAGIPLR
jgi:NADP-dependent 3-hydroxy acid dehydrogenase YdfG